MNTDEELKTKILKIIMGYCRAMSEIGSSKLTKKKTGHELQGVVVEIDDMIRDIRRLLDEQRRDIIEEIGASLTGTTLVFNGEQMLGIGIEKWKALRTKLEGGGGEK